MIEFNVTNNFETITKILPTEIKLSRTIISAITKIIEADINKNLSEGTGIDGAALQPKKYGGRLFYNTGRLLIAVKKKTFIKSGQIFILPVRSQIASYLNFGTSRIPKREFFGVSNRAKQEIEKLLQETPLDKIKD